MRELEFWLVVIVVVVVVALTSVVFVRADTKESGISNLRVTLTAAPVLTLKVKFRFEGEEREFEDLGLIRPIQQTEVTSSTFRTREARPIDVKNWASVTLIKKDRLVGMFMIDNGERTLRLETSYKASSQRRDLHDVEVIKTAPLCGTITHAEIERQNQLLNRQRFGSSRCKKSHFSKIDRE
jgi:hypothetical protein